MENKKFDKMMNTLIIAAFSAIFVIAMVAALFVEGASHQFVIAGMAVIAVVVAISEQEKEEVRDEQ
jgi:hypothetical protein